MKRGDLLAGRRPEEFATRLQQARDAGFFLCQLNLCQSGFTRADLVQIADTAVDIGVRPAAVGCHLNPMTPHQARPMGGTRADLDTLLHSLDILGARRIVFWSGTHSPSLYEEHADNAKRESVDTLHDFLTDVVNTTRARHYFLCIEPWHTHVLPDEDAIVRFHGTLDPHVQERVRYVLDVPSLMTASRYADCPGTVKRICEKLGPLAGVVHLRDVVMPPDGETALPGPCQGKLDYPAYLDAILANVGPDVPAIVRNISIDEFGEVRDRLLQLNHRWELT